MLKIFIDENYLVQAENFSFPFNQFLVKNQGVFQAGCLFN